MDIDLSAIADMEGVLAILLFGSTARDQPLARDIDICIVAPRIGDKASLLLKALSKVRRPGYDIWLFEELPLYMKVEVIRNHRVLHCRRLEELYDYFANIMALWRDQEVRIRRYSRLLKS